MKVLTFDIYSDDDFYCHTLFKIFAHENEDTLNNYMIRNLREISQTFTTSRDNVQRIKNCIDSFLTAYDNPSIKIYYCPSYNVWFDRSDARFIWNIEIDNGNQQITVDYNEYNITHIDGGYLIEEYGEDEVKILT